MLIAGYALMEQCDILTQSSLEGMMKKTYSITCEEATMRQIDETAKSLGLNRSSYLVFLAQSIEGVLGSQDERAMQTQKVVDALSAQSSLTTK